MDHSAEQHNGLTPTVATADQLSSSFKNPLYSDTENGVVAAYLEHDVPAWLEEHSQVDTRPQSQAVGGLSNGGTYATQVFSCKGGPYRTVLDMSGEKSPNLHNLKTAVDEGLGGDKTTFEENNPPSIFSLGEDFAGYSAFCSIGDKEPRGVIRGLWKACRTGHSQGVDVQERTYSETHEWKVQEKSLDDELPWLAAKMNLIRTPSR